MDWNQSLQAQRAALHWFTEAHLQSVIRNGSIPAWFHGIISRKTAEVLLMSRPPGYFLIRVSESRIGYTLSYRAEDRCRHFMIDAADDGQCVIVGEDRRHRGLHDLVEFHQRAPIAPFNEVLTVACGQTSSEGSDYADLLFPQRPPSHQAGLPPVDQSRRRLSHQGSQDEAPPVPPYLPGGLSTCAGVPQSLGLYPSLPEYPAAAASVQASDVPPVPKARSKFIADNVSSSPPPHVPTWHSAPPQLQHQASVPTMESPSSPTAPKHPTGAFNAGPVKNQEGKPSFVSKILQKRFQKRTSSLQEFSIPDGSTEPNLDHQQHFSCKEVTSQGMPQEYRLPPPFAPGFS